MPNWVYCSSCGDVTDGDWGDRCVNCVALDDDPSNQFADCEGCGQRVRVCDMDEHITEDCDLHLAINAIEARRAARKNR